jgi:hypothetical protein
MSRQPQIIIHLHLRPKLHPKISLMSDQARNRVCFSVLQPEIVKELTEITSDFTKRQSKKRDHRSRIATVIFGIMMREERCFTFVTNHPLATSLGHFQSDRVGVTDPPMSETLSEVHDQPSGYQSPIHRIPFRGLPSHSAARERDDF